MCSITLIAKKYHHQIFIPDLGQTKEWINAILFSEKRYRRFRYKKKYSVDFANSAMNLYSNTGVNHTKEVQGF